MTTSFYSYYYRYTSQLGLTNSHILKLYISRIKSSNILSPTSQNDFFHYQPRSKNYSKITFTEMHVSYLEIDNQYLLLAVLH